MSGLWVLLHVTIILHCLSNALAGMNNLNITPRSIREVNVSLDTRPYYIAPSSMSETPITSLLEAEHALWHTGLPQEKT